MVVIVTVIIVMCLSTPKFNVTILLHLRLNYNLFITFKTFNKEVVKG